MWNYLGVEEFGGKLWTASVGTSNTFEKERMVSI